MQPHLNASTNTSRASTCTTRAEIPERLKKRTTTRSEPKHRHPFHRLPSRPLGARVPSRPRVPPLHVSVSIRRHQQLSVSCGHDQCPSSVNQQQPTQHQPDTSATGNKVSKQHRAGVTNNSGWAPGHRHQAAGDVGRRASEAPGLGHWPCLSLSTAFIQTILISYHSFSEKSLSGPPSAQLARDNNLGPLVGDSRIPLCAGMR